MTKFKKLMALAAVSMLGIQLMGVGTAFAANDGDCDFGNNDLEVTLGDDGGDVTIWIDEDGFLQCDATNGHNKDSEALPATAVDSITVEMDHDDSTGELYILLDTGENHGESNPSDASDWPDFDTFDIDVTTTVHLDGQDVDEASANRLRITVGAKSVSFNGTTATSNTPKYEIIGGPNSDYIDGSKATARLTVEGGDGSDVIKGGAGKDDLDGNEGGRGAGGGADSDVNVDVIYGGAGNDSIDCGGDGTDTKFEQGWGGDGDDSIIDCNVVAPGAGNDDVYNDGTYAPGDCETVCDNSEDELVTISYADLSKGIEWDSSELLTGGAAGEDVLDSAPLFFTGSQGDDVIFDDASSKVYGVGGNDLIKVDGETKVYGGAGNDVISDVSGEQYDNKFYGEAGNDILRGKMGDDSLFGGGGQDQTWGGPGADTCGGEVTNRCEYFTKK